MDLRSRVTRSCPSSIPEVQSTSWYRSGGRIIVEWDESDADNSGVNGTGGGHIPTIVVSELLGPSPKRDSIPVNSAGILRSIEDAFGLAHLGSARVRGQREHRRTARSDPGSRPVAVGPVAGGQVGRARRGRARTWA